jgi:hypothetical protein
MKMSIPFLAAVLGLGTAAAPAARAGDDFRLGFSFGSGRGSIRVESGGYLFGHSHRRSSCLPAPRPVRPVHVHQPVPVYVTVWVPPVYQTVIVGRDWRGCPIYRTVCVRPGYHHQEIRGQRCGSCGTGL